MREVPCRARFGSGNVDHLTIFIDESGDTNFSPHGSPLYLFTALWTYDPTCIAGDLIAYRYELLKSGHDIQEFHAQHNPRPIRERVFAILASHHCMKAASVVVTKNRANPVLYDKERFYPQFLQYPLRFAIKGESHRRYKRILILADTPPTKKTGKAVRYALRRAVPTHMRPGATFNLYQHPSGTHSGLQAADYVCWAVNRKWVQNDQSVYTCVHHLFDKPPLDVFAHGTTTYY